MTVEEFLVQTFNCSPPSFLVRPRAVCADGFSVSIQAGSFAYCTPRETATHYEAVELGYPNAPDPDLFEYMENNSEDRDDSFTDPTDTVYPYVPLEVIEKVVAKHGGIVSWGDNVFIS
jgi:hypothetical protein